MSPNAKSRPKAALCGSCKPFYFIAPEAADDAAFIEPMADEAAMPADEAASIAEVAADEAAMADDDMASEADDIDEDIDELAGAIVAGGVIVVDVSSFLVQAAKDTAAARVTISIAVFIFLLGFKVRTISVIVGNPQCRRAPAFKDKEMLGISSA